MSRIRNLGAIIIDSIRDNYLRKIFAEVGKKDRLLDLGCGVKPFKNLYQNYSNSSVGIDVKETPHGTEQVDILYDGKKIPFNDNEFDLVFCTEVMEHVPEPKDFLNEIYRVLKPGGTLIMTVPFLVPLHEEPYDFYRYTSHGLKHLLTSTRFRDIKIETFSEYFGVLISFLVQIQLRFWNSFGKKIRLRVLSSVYNPFIFLLVYLPQVLYLKCYYSKLFKKISRKLSYTPKGYGFIAFK